MKEGLNNEIKYIQKPLMLSFVLLSLFFIVIYFGFNKIKEVTTKINESKRTETILTQKIASLEALPEVLAGDVTFLDIALPSKGTALYSLSQIRQQITAFNLTLFNVKTKDQDKGKDPLMTSVFFDVEGQEDDIYKFTESLGKVLPIMTVSKMTMDKSGAVAKASFTVDVYTSPLPQKIESISTSVPELTAEDISIIKEIASYKLPPFIEPTVSEPSERTDPFSL